MTASRILITAPSDAVMTPSEARTMLGLSSATGDALLEAMIEAVTNRLDPASGGWLGRALRPQTWELRLCEFPSSDIRLPYPPVTEVASVKYDDSNGVEQTLVLDTDYRVFGLGDMRETRVLPVYNGSWPAARYDSESVRIRYVAGYPTGDTDAMPGAIKAAIALGVRHLVSTGEQSMFLSGEDIPGVRSRRWSISSEAAELVERAMMDLLANLRVYF